MAEVAILGKLTAQPGKREALLDALQQLVKAAENEPGTLAYAVHASKDHDNEVWIYELYESAEAEEAHHTGEALQAVGPALEKLIGGAVEIIRLEPRGAKGVPV